MALVLKDRVQETSTTSGTGTLTLSGAVSGFQTFSTAIGNGNTTFYTIYDPTAYDWEVGIGTVGAGTLARTTVLSNSAGTTTQISFASNSKFVFCTYPAEKSINYDASGVATIGDVLGYSDTGIVGSFASTVAGYNQVIVQNKSTATNASSNLNVSNDAGTSGSNYAELGINSSTFTGSGSFNIAGASYVASASTDLTLGTYGAYNVHFVTNSSTTDAMTIYNNGGISLGTFGNPGIGNMAASKFVPGYTSITAAASTTVLTASSDYYQNLVGTTTQTIQLPDATTLLEGTTFIFDNDSTGTLTVVDNASGPIETIPAGAAGFVYLADNATVAGTWRRHAFLPASYDFNATTANFGNATITNAVWNGTTIGTAYGGTGLTSFSAANYALYSTNSSTLTAGTLPVAAGGSGAVTFTANGVLYGDGTNPLAVTAAGTTGQVLVGNTSGAPSWATLSSSTVSSFSAGTTGFTPNSATTGAVTLSGTLNVANGGTGVTTSTGSGDNVLNTSPSLVTPVLGTPSSGNLANCTFPTLNQNTTGSAATLTTGRTIAITGDLSYTSGSFNGSGNVTGTGTLATVNANVGSFTNANVTVNAKGLITAVSNGSSGGVTSVTGTSPVNSSGGTTPVISLAAGYGDTLNPYASKTAKHVLAAPNAANGVPSFRAIVASDIPTLNQNTTGSSGSTTGNAASATVLQTTRAINGTNFNGSAAITTTNWGTSRTLWGNSINGSADITAALQPSAGSASAPAFSTSGDTNTGIYFPSADTIGFTRGGAEAMRIINDGQLFLGTSSLFSAGAKLQVLWNPSSQQGITLKASGTTFTGNAIYFANNADGQSGVVSQTQTTVTYTTSSDYRLKENILPMTGALDKVALLKPVTYTWKLDGSKGQGFIAHELQAIIPDAVVGEKDAVEKNGNIKPQSVDTSFIVATLTAAIQEQQTIIDTLKATLNEQAVRITALESKLPVLE
jgi:hypothetical protein